MLRTAALIASVLAVALASAGSARADGEEEPVPSLEPEATGQLWHGRLDPAVYRPSTGEWLIAGRTPVVFGGPSDVPVPGQWDADAELDLAVWRPASDGWLVQGQAPVYLGRPGDIP